MYRRLSADISLSQWFPKCAPRRPWEPPLIHRGATKYYAFFIILFPFSIPTSPGYDLITGKILQELPLVGIKYITQFLNASLLLGFFPNQWKVAQIILLLNHGKPPNVATSYRPIRLLATLSKVFQRPPHTFLHS
jgi:hypothetical protein